MSGYVDRESRQNLSRVWKQEVQERFVQRVSSLRRVGRATKASGGPSSVHVVLVPVRPLSRRSDDGRCLETRTSRGWNCIPTPT